MATASLAGSGAYDWSWPGPKVLDRQSRRGRVAHGGAWARPSGCGWGRRPPSTKI